MLSQTKIDLFVSVLALPVILGLNYLTFGRIKIFEYALAPEKPEHFISIELCDTIRHLAPIQINKTIAITNCSWPDWID